MEKSIFMFFRIAKRQSSYQSTVSFNYARELMKGETDIETTISALEEKYKSNEHEATDTLVTKIATLLKNNMDSIHGALLDIFYLNTKCLYEKNVAKLTDWNAFTKKIVINTEV